MFARWQQQCPDHDNSLRGGPPAGVSANICFRGDKIIEVNGVEVDFKPHADIVHELKKPLPPGQAELELVLEPTLQVPFSVHSLSLLPMAANAANLINAFFLHGEQVLDASQSSEATREQEMRAAREQREASAEGIRRTARTNASEVNMQIAATSD